jgi:signal transduction histidine kinase
VLDRLRASSPGFIEGSRGRSLIGMAIMLGAIAAEAPRFTVDPTTFRAIVALSILAAIGWILQGGPRAKLGIWILGITSCVLMVVLPGTGPVVGVIAALVTIGMRVPGAAGVRMAVVIGGVFLVAYAYSTHLNSLPSLVFTAMGLGFAYSGTTSVRRVREERERAEALLAELQRTRAAELERAALAERTRIAREIHDVLAHTLSALAVQLEGTRMLVEQRPGDPAATAAVERAHRLAVEGLVEARRAISALRGDNLPGPDGLARLIDEFSEATGTPSHFEVSGGPFPLAPEAQLTLFRTAQEALTNVRKHAHASTVDVQLRYAADGAELVVEDADEDEARALNANGSGASGAAVAAGEAAGYGLVGMRERAELVGGTLEAGPLPTGYRVRLWLPKQ